MDEVEALRRSGMSRPSVQLESTSLLVDTPFTKIKSFADKFIARGCMEKHSPISLLYCKEREVFYEELDALSLFILNKRMISR